MSRSARAVGTGDQNDHAGDDIVVLGAILAFSTSATRERGAHVRPMTTLEEET
jgi:hypothetical protein